MSPAELKLLKESQELKAEGGYCRLVPQFDRSEGIEDLPSEQMPELTKKQKLSRAAKVHKNIVIVFVTGIALALAGLSYNGINHLLSFEQTDDAYTTGHLHQISTRINGTVDRVLVDDNEHVKAGQVLVLLDPRDFEVRVKQAEAALATASHQADAAQTNISLSDISASGRTTEAQGQVADAKAAIEKSQALVAQAKASIKSAEAQLVAKKAELARAEVDYHRFVELANEGAVSLHDRDAAIRDYEVSKAARDAAAEDVKHAYAQLTESEHSVGSARAQLMQSAGSLQQAKATHVQTTVNEHQFQVAEAAIQQAEAQLADAQLQLSYTKIVAPTSGRVGRKTAEAGQRVQPGQQLMTVVSDDLWLLANFKETQLEKMRPGQPVEITVDSFPHKKFAGVVDSIAPGSGATFALLPPDNATGNFTKIVQRVPVKVRFTNESKRGFENLLVPGMSVVASVKVK